jgi:hypothetical protein
MVFHYHEVIVFGTASSRRVLFRDRQNEINMMGKIPGALASPIILLAAFILLLPVAYILLAPKPRRDSPETFSPDRYLWPQAPTTKFTVKKVRESLKELDPAELVLGVAQGKETRAYPINMLNHQPATKVVNDELDGRPVMATWCDSAHNAIVYSREVDGKTLTFGVFGQLWKGSMVMYDQETMTHWSHFLGEAKRGLLQGKRLTPIPSFVTDWENWSRLNPEGTVTFLPKGPAEYTQKVFVDREKYLLGIAGNGRAKAWSFSDLEKRSPIHDSWEGQPVVVVFDASRSTARLYGRTVKGQDLTFTQEGKELKDRETGTTWELLTGQGKAGPLAGQHLPSFPAFVSYRKIWDRFYPASVVPNK